MARGSTVLPVKIVHVRGRRVVQLAERAFNPDQIVALSNSGTDQTIIHTRGQVNSWVIDLPLHEAVRLLNGEEPNG